MAKETRTKCLRGRIAALRGTRNLAVLDVLSRLLRSVRLALHPAQGLIPRFPNAKHLFRQGFTLIEVLVVLSIIATLLTLVAPRYFEMVERSKETTLKHDLIGMRDAIDKYYSDTGNYPYALDDLVAKKYLRAIPEDPITGSDKTWVMTPPVSLEVSGSVYDIHSGSPGIAQDGSNYADW